MAPKIARKSAMQRAFVDKLAATGDAVYAADRAGYCQPATAASKLLAVPGVRREVEREVRSRLDKLALMTLGRFDMMLADPQTPNRDVVAIGKVVMTHWQASVADASSAKEVAELSGPDLAKRVEAALAKIQAFEEAEEAEIVDDDTADDGLFD